MPRQSPKRVTYSTGTINPAPAPFGGWDAYVRVDGVRYRARKETLEDAKAWITMTEEAHQAHRPPLSREQTSDAGRALSLLPPGYTLTDAARALSTAITPPAAPAVPLEEAAQRFLDARRPFVAAATLRGYKNTCERFARMAGGDLGNADAEAVKNFLFGMGPETRNSKLRHLSAFFNWCIEERLVDRSPLQTVKRAPRQDSEIHILTVDQARCLIGVAVTMRRQLVPYFALALFAGIRPEELQRLPQGKLGRDYILIDGGVAKKRRRRTIPIQPNLRAWLDAFPPAAGTLIPWSRRGFRDVIVASGLTWHNDIMRHTFGSMRWEVVKDPIQVAAEMGNSPDILLTAYRALVAPGDGAAYFNIWPACALRNAKNEPVCPTGFQHSP